MTGTRPVSQGRYSKNQDPWGQDWWDSFDDLPPGVPLPSLYRGDRFVESGSHYCWDIMLPNRVTVTVLDVEVFPADRQVWECPDCTCDNYLDPGGLPEPCSYCGAEVELL
jgi:hypothetical protein